VVVRDEVGAAALAVAVDEFEEVLWRLSWSELSCGLLSGLGEVGGEREVADVPVVEE
jgi:hypothetical protein